MPTLPLCCCYAGCAPTAPPADICTMRLHRIATGCATQRDGCRGGRRAAGGYKMRRWAAAFPMGSAQCGSMPRRACSWAPARCCRPTRRAPDGCAPELLVVHGISLPPNEFGGPWIDRLFTGTLPADAHPPFRSAGSRASPRTRYPARRSDRAVRAVRGARLACGEVGVPRPQRLQRLLDRSGARGDRRHALHRCAVS